MRSIWKPRRRRWGISSNALPFDHRALSHAKGLRVVTLWLLLPLLATAPGCATYNKYHDSGGYGSFAIWSDQSKPVMLSWIHESGFPPAATGEPIKKNPRLAVAQLGEPLAELWMVEPLLRSKRFASIEPCTGGDRYQRKKFPRYTTRPTTQQQENYARGFVADYIAQARAAMETARLAASKRGCDYVLVVIYHSSGQYEGPVIPLIDFLMFPLYVIPHEKAVGHAGGVALLIDAASGRVVRRFMGQTDATRLSTYINMDHAVPLAITQAQNRLAESMAKGVGEPPKRLK